MKQKESEVEAAIGRSDVQGGDSPREGGLPATRTQDLESAHSEGDVVATQLDVLAKGSRRRARDRHKLCISNL